MGIGNIHFPLLVNENVLRKEKDHIEVVWVTKSRRNDLDTPITLRPTNETDVYSCFSMWIITQEDLPLKLNEWCKLLLPENRHPIPFIRSREFLWQDGHTAFATKEADNEVLEILELYRRIYEEYLAIPVVKGRKSALEKIACGLYTTSVEVLIVCCDYGSKADVPTMNLVEPVRNLLWNINERLFNALVKRFFMRGRNSHYPK